MDVDSVIELASSGFKVFPLRNFDATDAEGNRIGKTPACKWKEWATSDTSKVAAHWKANPKNNVAIKTGDGLLIIDVDAKDDFDGSETISAWESEHGKLPPTLGVETGSGGYHYYYRVDREISNSVSGDRHVDIRCDGGYVVAPPSIHPVTGRPYEWDGDFTDPEEIADADENVYALVEWLQDTGASPSTGGRPRFELPDEIRMGERDNILSKYAFHLQSLGRPDDEILYSVYGANALLCKEKPMTKPEVRRIVHHVTTDYPKGRSREWLESHSIGAPGAGAVDDGGGEQIQFVGPRGGIAHNLLGDELIRSRHARTIDNSIAIWTGRRWEFGSTAIEDACIDLAPSIKSNTRSEVVKYLRSKAPRVSSRSMDTTPYVQFGNVTLSLEGEIVTPDPSMLITNTLPFDYNPDARSTLVDNWLRRMADGDPCTERLYEQVMAACVFNRHMVDEAAMLIGFTKDGRTASNGKSTFLHVIKELIGSQNYSTLSMQQLGETFMTAQLVGMLANIGDDISDIKLEKKPLENFKKAATGDDFTVEEKGERPFTFTPQAALVFSMNSIPSMSLDEGVSRRLAFVPFRSSFKPTDPDYNRHIKRDLTTDIALQSLAVRALRAAPSLYESEHYEIPPDMVGVLSEVEDTNNPVIRWVNEEHDGDISVLKRELVRELYREWQEWYGRVYRKSDVPEQTWWTRQVTKAYHLKTEKTSIGGIVGRRFVSK